MSRTAIHCMVFLLSLVFINSCAVQSSVIKSGFDFSTIKRVAVLDFKNADQAPISGQMASDIFIKYLLLGGYDVVERSELANILKENNITSSGAAGPKQIKNIGKISGVDALVTGSVFQFIPEKDYYSNGNVQFVAAQVGITAKVIDAGTGEVLWSGSNSYDGMNTQVAAEYLISSLVRQMMSDFDSQ